MGNGAIVQLKVIFYSPFTNGLQRDLLSAFASVVWVWHLIPSIGGAGVAFVARSRLLRFCKLITETFRG